MRKIAFRAWDKEDREMCQVLGIQFDEEELIKVEYKFFGHKNSCLRYPSQIELMQYTGFKNKNGKEIYEGDILSVPFTDIGNTKHKPEIVTIIWDSPTFEFGNTGKVFGNIKYSCKDSEVIGNIYENPELIKNLK